MKISLHFSAGVSSAISLSIIARTQSLRSPEGTSKSPQNVVGWIFGQLFIFPASLGHPHSHIAAEIKSKAGEAKQAAKADEEKRNGRKDEVNLTNERRTRSGGGSPSRDASKERHKAWAEQMEKELAALKQKINDKPKKSGKKRSHSCSSDCETSSESSSGLKPRPAARKNGL